MKAINFSSSESATRLLRAMMDCDLAVIWFAGGHAAATVLLAKLLGKKSIIVVGGFDVACIPEINYGRFTQSWTRRLLTKLALHHADRVLVVDPSLKDDAIKNAGVNGHNIEYLPTGFSSLEFHPQGEKEPQVLTVAMGESWERVQIKGIDVFVESAKHLPQICFRVVGIDGEALLRLKEMAPENVQFTGHISQDELVRSYQRAMIYCQLSMREGLPNALCEAMLCECIPVGTDRNGIPTAIGDTGFIVPYGEPVAAAEAIRKALQDRGDRGSRARERIVELFPEKRREDGLIRTMNELIKAGPDGGH
ncbi:MAG TPA: glycosyltransferase family 4 protein [Methanothrix sp.]|uniref:glycosyltransferase family 4 protein n=1 Tax=Methanothrix sp. TaxID=90426 RepID=UPI002C633A4A|nr:glycosyltransferase family 4 protein [Methanothrix sp.]MDI9417680.1 glycosyltransferase family 4 protein [Euryarchaeota archaeon]HON34809.1 glycosyltransferase family 4 protein [Methanothrix sp.]HRU76183.1 glycosyltransferase family 4 protein [Methanothrix sp.]